MIDDFYAQMMNSMDIMTSSTRMVDILNHIKYVKPDAFVYCVHDDSKSKVMQLMEIKSILSKEFIPFITIGSESDIQNFERVSGRISDRLLIKPLKASAIEEQIVEAISVMKDQKNSFSKNMMQKVTEEEEKRNRKQILIVDDDATMLKAMKEHLIDQYNVATAINGKVAMKYLEKRKPDLVLLDYEMPNENGSEVLAKIRANKNLEDLPVVFLTGDKENFILMNGEIHIYAK